MRRNVLYFHPLRDGRWSWWQYGLLDTNWRRYREGHPGRSAFSFPKGRPMLDYYRDGHVMWRAIMYYPLDNPIDPKSGREIQWYF